MNDNDSERRTREALLVFEAAIDWQENIKVPGRELQQFTIGDAGPPRLLDGFDLVPRKLATQSAWKALVKQHAHRRSDGPSLVQGQQQRSLE